MYFLLQSMNLVASSIMSCGVISWPATRTVSISRSTSKQLRPSILTKASLCGPCGGMSFSNWVCEVSLANNSSYFFRMPEFDGLDWKTSNASCHNVRFPSSPSSCSTSSRSCLVSSSDLRRGCGISMAVVLSSRSFDSVDCPVISADVSATISPPRVIPRVSIEPINPSAPADEQAIEEDCRVSVDWDECERRPRDLRNLPGRRLGVGGFLGEVAVRGDTAAVSCAFFLKVAC
ncbi:hypothetical protein B0H63DRAFT_473260 [Podospora didyma]|uniref:Uncharacterized protein n=1 Tax=Podospora didyma TaxID=330526 RepID=A0AAE0NQ42_9PEZI|nr:hypothetical protein B0H63DRAFT_473260 [Podospora didyma]